MKQRFRDQGMSVRRTRHPERERRVLAGSERQASRGIPGS